MLVHHNIDKPSILTFDTSSFGLRAVLVQKEEDGSLKPDPYVFRTLNESQKNSSQTEKECLDLVLAVDKFHKYLYCGKFEILTDHKQLLGLLRENKAVQSIASGRII